LQCRAVGVIDDFDQLCVDFLIKSQVALEARNGNRFEFHCWPRSVTWPPGNKSSDKQRDDCKDQHGIAGTADRKIEGLKPGRR